jgi:ribosomal protein S18 acetylase RimI-like enzyme
VRAREADGTCHIGRLIVTPELQGRGIGTRLLRAIEARFPGARRFELFTGSRSAANLRLYERLGFRRCREQTLSPAVTLVFMEKTL